MGRVRWDVDDRKQSVLSWVYVAGMRAKRDKRAFQGREHTRETALERQRVGDAPPTRLTRATRRVTTGRVDGTTVWTVRPRRGVPVARVVYVHGGGYVHPLTKDYWRLVRALSSSPAEVLVPAYGLAPGNTVDEVLPTLSAIVARAVDGDLPVVLMGDSAGGALVVTLAQQARDEGRAGASFVVALCPWLDATLDERDVADLESTDPMLDETGLRAAGRWWAGVRNPSDPLVSPLSGRLDGLPPVEVMIGDRDILRPAVDDLAEKAGRCAMDLHVLEVPAMFHVWMTRAIPEGRRARRHLRRVVAGARR